MNKLQLIGISFLITNFTLFGQTTAQWKSLNTESYSIQYPENWELVTSGQMNTSFVIFSELSSETDPFRENVNLIIQDLKGYHMDLDKVC